jgi:hypothetical protein
VSNWPYIRGLIRGYSVCVHSVLAFAKSRRDFSRACLGALQCPVDQRDFAATIRRKIAAEFVSRIIFMRYESMKEDVCITFCPELEEMEIETYS